MTTYKDTDGAVFLASLSLGMGVWFTIREQPTRALILQDSQHEYAFEEDRR